MDQNKQIQLKNTSGLTLVFNSQTIRESLPEEIAKMLKEVFYIIGLKQMPKPEEFKYLISFVLSDLKRFTLLDIPEAFKRIASGEIKGDLEHYNSFSPTYLGKVMKFYEEWKRKEILELKKKEEQNQKIAEHQAQLNKSPEQRREDCRTAYEGLAKYVEVNKSLPIGWSWIDCYWYMEANGLVTKDPEEKKMFADYVRNMIEQEKKDAIATGGLLSGKNIEKLLNNKFDFAHRCRIEMVKSFFKQKINK
jgi:hypothetical protein